MSSEMQISISQMEGRIPVTVFHIKGQIDANTHKELTERATEAKAMGTQDILLDLTDVTYMASAGFRAMHSIHKMLQTDESDDTLHLKVLNPSEEVSRIIKTLGFDAYVSTHSDLKEAVNSF